MILVDEQLRVFESMIDSKIGSIVPTQTGILAVVHYIKFQLSAIFSLLSVVNSLFHRSSIARTKECYCLDFKTFFTCHVVLSNRMANGQRAV